MAPAVHNSALLASPSLPRVFTKVMAEALEPLRPKGIAIVPYLDNLLLFAESKGQLLTNLEVMQGQLNKLGWLLNRENLYLVPAQQVRFLGCYSVNATNNFSFWKKKLP